MKDEISFDILRAVHGVGGAAAAPSAMGIIFGLFQPGKGQIYAMATYSAGFPLGNVIGNVLGGVIAEYVGWKWLFWLMAIITGVCWTLAWFIVPPLPKDTEIQSIPLRKRLDILIAQMDWVGLAMSVVFLVFLLVSLTEGNVSGWTAPHVLTLLIISVLLFPVFTIWQLRLEKINKRPPLMKLSVFKSPMYCAAQAVSFIFWASFNNFLVYATFFYQDY